MCKAFEDYKNLGKSEGREEGIKAGELKKKYCYSNIHDQR